MTGMAPPRKLGSVIIRADASTRTGSGHVTRCVALAQVLRRRGWQVRFATRAEPGHLHDWLTAQGFALTVLDTLDERADAAATMRAGAGAAWFVVDHYALHADWERAVRRGGARVLAIDDLGRPHACDRLLDQNLGNPLHMHYLADGGIVQPPALGPSYALLRGEFAALRADALRRRAGQLERLLICMGGSDPGNETLKVLDGLAGSPASRLAMDVVVGAANPHRASVAAACARLPAARLHVQTDKMAQLTLEADCAIGAGGTSSWERCCLGLPSLTTILSPDQLAPGQALAATGAQQVLGPAAELAPSHYARAVEALGRERLQAMAEAAFAVCDGRGAERVADLLQPGGIEL